MLRTKRSLNNDYYLSVISGYILIAFNMIAQVFLIPLYVKYLGSYKYGVFLLIFSFINYAAVGIGFMSGGALRLLGEKYSIKDYKALSTSYTVSKYTYVLYSLLVSAAFILYALCIKGSSYFSDSYLENIKIICVTCVYIIIKYDFSVEIQLLVGTQRQFWANIFQILTQLFYLMLVIPYIIFSSTNISGVLFCNLAGLIIARFMIAWYKWIKKIPVNLERYNESFIPYIKKLFGKMGIGYTIYGLIIITYQADLLIMGTISNNPEIITQYGIIWKVAEAGIMLLWKVPETMQPYIIELDAQGNSEALQKQYSHIYKITFILSSIAAFVFLICGKFFIKIWMGTSYIPINNICIILTAAAIFFDGIKRTPAIYAYSLVKRIKYDIWIRNLNQSIVDSYSIS